jgi:hypothetical protein
MIYKFEILFQKQKRLHKLLQTHLSSHDDPHLDKPRKKHNKI